MGIIQKQSIKGTVYSYLGVILGFITTAILFPRLLSTNEIGLLKLIVSFSVIFGQLGSLGFNSVINRLFPYFRDTSQKHKDFIAFALFISLIGFLITIISFEIYKPILIRNNMEKSYLLTDYIFLIIPLIFSILFFNLFDTYNKVLYDTVLGTFLKEFLQRLLILGSLLLYYFNIIDLHVFVIAYVIAFLIPTLILLLTLIKRGEISFKIRMEYLSKTILKEMLSICIFSFISGLGGLAIVHIDSLLVNKFMGISMTGIYATTFFFGTLVLIPSRPLIKISTTVVADSWKERNIENIKLIYKKSCINQSTIGLLIFIGLWINIHNIFKILPPEFEIGKYVIFFIGLANLIEMNAGVSGIIIGTSKYYRYNALFISVFLLLIIGLNYIFIPLYGLAGAAFATTLSKLLYTLLRFVFLKIKFKMQPYNYKFLILLAIGLISYFAAYFLPEMNNFILDIIVRSLIVTIVFGILILLFNVSVDINNLYKTTISKLRSFSNRK